MWGLPCRQWKSLHCTQVLEACPPLTPEAFPCPCRKVTLKCMCRDTSGLVTNYPKHALSEGWQATTATLSAKTHAEPSLPARGPAHVLPPALLEPYFSVLWGIRLEVRLWGGMFNLGGTAILLASQKALEAMASLCLRDTAPGTASCIQDFLILAPA